MARATLQARLLTMLTAVLAAAMAAGGIALALDDEHSDPDHPHLDTASGLLVTNRSALRMCVEAGPDATDTANPDAIRAGLLAGLAQARHHPNWRTAYGRADHSPATVLDFGCPAPRLPQRHEPKTTIAGPGLTDDPSAYRVWVYILDEPTADRVLGADETTAVAAAELMKESTTLFPVSTALIIRQSRLTDTDTVAHGLQAALGLDPQM